MADTQPADTILVHDEGPVRIVTFNRPERKNALLFEALPHFAALLRKSDEDPAVRAIVLTGAGGAFCAGGDVKNMGRRTPEEAPQRVAVAQDAGRATISLQTPLIAGVEGVAFGAGLALAAAADRVVAAEDARFGAGFVNVGLSGDFGALWSVPRRIGHARARQLLLMAEVLDAREAQALGLADVLVPPGAALERAVADAQILATRPPRALARIKRLYAGVPATLEEALRIEGEAQAEALASDEHAEAAAAFAEKRRPTYPAT